MWWKYTYNTLFRSFIQSLLHPALWQPSPTKQFVRILCISLSFSTLSLFFICLSLNKDHYLVNYLSDWMDFSAPQTLLLDVSWGFSKPFIILRDETQWENGHLEQHLNANQKDWITHPFPYVIYRFGSVEKWVSTFKRRPIRTTTDRVTNHFCPLSRV